MSNAFDLTVKALREQGLNSDEILEVLSKLSQNLVDFNNKLDADVVTEAKIRKILRELCMPVNIKGYNCWVAAIKIYKNGGKGMSMVRDIYPQVAKACRTTPSKAERVMRTAVEKVFDRCPVDTIDSMFGNNFNIKKRKFTNTEFIVSMAELI